MFSSAVRTISDKFAHHSLSHRFHAMRRSSFCSSSSSWAVNAGKQQHVVVALGGNALLKRGEPMTVANQRKNVADGVASLVPILRENVITFVHGNGPQVGLLALQGAAYQKESGGELIDLDVLDAETEGMIGYLIEQELDRQLDRTRGVVTVLSQIVVDANDAAFENPTKFIGPVYTKEEAEKLVGKTVKPDGKYYRQVVASPRPIRLIDQQMRAVRLLTDNDCIVICAGGGGIPVVEDHVNKRLKGVEAVIDKDRAAAMLGITLQANSLLILTDVSGVALGYGTPEEKWIKSASPEKMRELASNFPDGSMGPKVESVVDFVQHSSGGWGAIGSLNEATKIVTNDAGTLVTSANGPNHLEFY